MIAWMIYVELVTLTVGLAALAAEQALRRRGARSRVVWLVAMLGSLVIAAVGGPAPPREANSVSSPIATATRLDGPAALAPVRWLGGAARRADSLPLLDDFLRFGWVCGSVALALLLCGTSANLRWQRRRWRERRIGGFVVRVAPDLGPAALGVFRPGIVVPEWLSELPPAQQELVIEHERAHLRAKDPQLLALALCALVCMPWNGPLWWQLRRLRRGIEVDCDTAILRSGVAARDYGETLLAVGRLQSASLAAVVAMSEPRTFLEERISIMMRKPSKYWRLIAAACGTLSLALVATATQVPAPAAVAALPGGTPSAVPPHASVAVSVLDSYAGYYQYGADAQVTTVTREGDHLLVEFPGWPALPMYPRTDTKFFATDTEATVSFTPGKDGASAASLKQNGARTPMQRIDAQTAQRLRAATAAKVAKQQNNPASETALRRMIAGISAGKPDLAPLNPQLAAALRSDLPKLQAKLERLGPVQSIQPAGVSASGMDVYDVRHEHGSSQWSLELDSGGTIIGAMVPL